jgi:hypothetical protein
MGLFNPSRDEVRDFFFETWSKYNKKQALTDLEKICLSVILIHPEYQTILSSPKTFKNQAYFPELGESNPFLHMSLHLSIIEQIRINQPFGIETLYESLKIKHQDEHFAQHEILDCLAETIWLAQRNKAELDSENYLKLIKDKIIN